MHSIKGNNNKYIIFYIIVVSHWHSENLTNTPISKQISAHINSTMEKLVSTFPKADTHTCSLASSRSTTPCDYQPTLCRWVASTMSSCWWRNWCGSACRCCRIWWGSPTYSQSKNLQECTAHSKLLHKSPQGGEGERKDMGGYMDYDKNM